jgi:BMFP domain-containing protein YqiC
MNASFRVIVCTTFGHARSLASPYNLFMQKPSQLFEQMQTIAVDMQNKIGEVIRNSPAKDIEKNVRAMMTQGFQRMDLVTREEFDIQSKVLAKTREKLEALEAKVAALENKS